MTRLERGAFVFVLLGVLFALWMVTAQISHAHSSPSVRPGPLHCDRVGCLRRRVWKKRALALSASDWAWLHSTGDCETYGTRRSASYRVAGKFFGRYQFALSTVWKAGFTLRPDLTWRYEQDVRAIRWRNRAGRGQWPNCG